MQRAAPTEPMDNFMQSMKVSELLAALDEFRSKLIAHRELWGKSLDDIVPGFRSAVSKSLKNKANGLRPSGCAAPLYRKFDSNWITSTRQLVQCGTRSMPLRVSAQSRRSKRRLFATQLKN